MSNTPSFQQPQWNSQPQQPQFQQPEQFQQSQFQQQSAAAVNGFQPQQNQVQQQPSVQFQQQNTPVQFQQPQMQVQPQVNNPALPQNHQFSNDEIPAFLRPTPTPEEQLVAAQSPSNYPSVGDEPRAVAGVSTNPWEEILANFPDGRFVGVVSCGGNNMLVGRLRENIIMADATSSDAVSPVRGDDIRVALQNGGLTSVYWRQGYPDALFVQQPPVQQQQQQQQQQQPSAQAQVQTQPQQQSQQPTFQVQQQAAQQDPVGQQIADNSPGWGKPQPSQPAKEQVKDEPDTKKGAELKVNEKVVDKATRKTASKTVSVKVRGVLDRIAELELELAYERAKLMHSVTNDE